MPSVIDPPSADLQSSDRRLSDSRKRLIQLVEDTSRRWRRWHLLECGTGGAAVGLALFVLNSFLLRSNRFGGNKEFALLAALGLLFGILAGFATVPSRQAVLARIDAVLGNDQLLSSAWWSHGENNRWHQSILALAARRCSGSQPQQFVPRNINSSGWSIMLVVAVTAVSVRALNVTHADPTPIRLPAPFDDAWKSWATAGQNSPAATSLVVSTPANSAIEAKAENPQTVAASNRDSNYSRLVSNDLADHPASRSNAGIGPGTSSDLQHSPPAPTWAGETVSTLKTSDVSIDPAAANARTALAGFGMQYTAAVSHGNDTLLTGMVIGSDGTSGNVVSWGSFATHSQPLPETSTRDVNDGVPAAYRKLAIAFYRHCSGSMDR